MKTSLEKKNSVGLAPAAPPAGVSPDLKIPRVDGPEAIRADPALHSAVSQLGVFRGVLNEPPPVPKYTA